MWRRNETAKLAGRDKFNKKKPIHLCKWKIAHWIENERGEMRWKLIYAFMLSTILFFSCKKVASPLIIHIINFNINGNGYEWGKWECRAGETLQKKLKMKPIQTEKSWINIAHELKMNFFSLHKNHNI